MSRNRMLARLGLLAAVAAMFVATSPVASTALPAKPSLKMLRTVDSVQVMRWGPDDKGWLNLGLHVTAMKSALELVVQRSRYDRPITTTQILRSGRTVTSRRILARTQSFAGLTSFFAVSIVNETGSVVARWNAPFCPNTYGRQRIAPDANERTRYPDSCGSSVWTRGDVWGLDAGWAVPLEFGEIPVRLPDGVYTARVGVNRIWSKALDLTPSLLDASVEFTLTTEIFEEPPFPTSARSRGLKPAPRAKVTAVPGPHARPDLVALPAWSIQFQGSGDPFPEPPSDPPVPLGSDPYEPPPTERDILIFGATVWNAGPAPLVIDGFRKPGQDLMDAYQSFYAGNRRVGYVPTGTLEYDPRDGHNHWHFTDFATHRLLDATATKVVMGEKEAFCLAPTDAIDRTVPGATLRPESTGLGSACGGLESLALREVLPAGWGDTYGAGTTGQSFDVTDLPNGTYFIEVVANPDGRVFEKSMSNNRALRKIVISGSNGARKVWAEPYQGLRI